MSSCSADGGAPIQRWRANRTPKPCEVTFTLPFQDVSYWTMRDSRTDVILATGGTPMVRAAYGSGNPAIGVGSGNVPIYVDASADIEAAAQTIVAAKNFDHEIGRAHV